MRFILSLLLLLATQVWGIVDIAPVEVGDKPGVSGNIAGSYTNKSGNTEKDEYAASAKLQYDSNASYVTFLKGSYERTKTYNVTTEDESFLHARYLHKLNDETLYGEAFVQYRENVFKGIDSRWLVGGGIRWRAAVVPYLGGKVYIGVGAFREVIDYTVSPTAAAGTLPEPDESTTRLNSYLAYTNQISDSAKMSLVGYYQPSFEDKDDEYASFLAELEVHIIRELYLSFIYEIDYDSMPPQGIKKQDRTTKTSLVWKF